MSLFKNHSLSAMRDSIARYLPGGRLFISKNKPLKNLYMFIEGLGVEAQRANGLLKDYNDQYYPDQTTDFLEEWERALGIPDGCLEVEGLSFVERRRNILVKLAGMAVQTAEDFESVAAAFGVTATVVGGLDPLVIPPIAPDKTARFSIVVIFTTTNVFPYTFPFVFGGDPIPILTCLFLQMRPANCQVVFQAA